MYYPSPLRLLPLLFALACCDGSAWQPYLPSSVASYKADHRDYILVTHEERWPTNEAYFSRAGEGWGEPLRFRAMQVGKRAGDVLRAQFPGGDGQPIPSGIPHPRKLDKRAQELLKEWQPQLPGHLRAIILRYTAWEEETIFFYTVWRKIKQLDPSYCALKIYRSILRIGSSPDPLLLPYTFFEFCPMGSFLLAHTRMGRRGGHPHKRFVTLHLFFSCGDEEWETLAFQLGRLIDCSAATKELAGRLRIFLTALLPCYRSCWGAPLEKESTVGGMLKLLTPPLPPALTHSVRPPQMRRNCPWRCWR